MSKRFVKVETIVNAMQKGLLASSLTVFVAAASCLNADEVLHQKFRSAVVNEETIIEDFQIDSDSKEQSAQFFFFFDDNNTTVKMLDEAFLKLKKEIPQAIELDRVYAFVSEGLGDVRAERIAMDCDISNMMLNVSFRLPDGCLLSVNKPKGTENDSLVMFNFYRHRRLLVADMADISLVKEYVHNVEAQFSSMA